VRSLRNVTFLNGAVVPTSFARPLAAGIAIALVAVGLNAATAGAATVIAPQTHAIVGGSNDSPHFTVDGFNSAVGTSTIVDFAAGNSAIYGLTDDNTVIGGGATNSYILNNVNSAIGERTVADLAGNLFGYAAVMTDGSVYLWGGTETVGDALLAGKDIVKVEVSGYNALALDADGTTYAWGSDSNSQVSGMAAAIGSHTVDDIAVGSNHMIALLDDGTVVGWGDNTYNETNTYTPPAERTVTSIAAATLATFVTLDDGTLVARGYNSTGYGAAAVAAIGTSHAERVVAGESAAVVLLSGGSAAAFSYESSYDDGQQLLIDSAGDHRITNFVFGAFNYGLVYSDVRVEFSTGSQSLDDVVLAPLDEISVVGSGSRGGVSYSVKWDAAVKATGATTSAGNFTETLAVPTGVGHHTVTVTIDGEDYVQSVTVGAVMAAAKPTISGTTKVDGVLTATTGAWAPGVTFGYQWLREGKAIGGATASTYTLVPADYKKHIQVKVTGSKVGFASVSKTSTATAAIGAGTLAPAQATVTGSFTVGSTLTAVPGTWGPVSPTFSYQWYANGTAISKATKSTFVIPGSALDKLITVRVTGKASGYSSVASYSAVGAFADRGTITIPSMFPVADADAVGYTYSVYFNGTAPTGTLSYQWYSNDVLIPAATKSTYKATTADTGLRLKVRVTAYKVGYVGATRLSGTSNVVFAQAAKTTSLAISGTPKAGSTLTLTAKGATAGAALSYGMYAEHGEDYVSFDAVDGFPTKFIVPSGIKGWKITGYVESSKSGLASSTRYSAKLTALS
jgi:hypothetical protein